MRKLYYPKIPGPRDCPLQRCLAFEKYDGTNLHWVWDREFGWHAFGTRRDEFNLDARGIQGFSARHEHLAGCEEVFLAALAEGLERIFRQHPFYQPFAELTAFTEYFGPSSFAGLHKDGEPKQVRLIDVYAPGYGWIAPGQFVADFGELQAARVVYEGKFTGKFADDVRTGKFDVGEGVVIKGGSGGDDVWMAKLKTYAYMERLKAAFAQRWEDYWE